MKQHDWQKATLLRKSGLSYRSINQRLGIPMGTLAYHFSGVTWSEQVKRRLEKSHRENSSVHMKGVMAKRKRAWQEQYAHAEGEAERSFRRFLRERLFIAGLVAYWGEGDNGSGKGMLRITNTDPAMVKLYFEFLKRYLPDAASRVKMHLILYPDLDQDECKSFWSQKVNIPLDRFIESSYIGSRSPTKRLKYGIGILYVSSKVHKVTMLKWIALLRENMQHAGIV